MVASNIAISLADKGHKTVLVDLDLRNPSVLRIEEDELSGNIGGYLKGEYVVEEVINQYQDYPLDVVYGVDSYENAPELLSGPSLEKLIRALKERYEYVILDVPPLYILEDALIISRYCDTGRIMQAKRISWIHWKN